MVRFRYRLSTLLLVIACICALSAGLYYSRLFVESFLAGFKFEPAPQAVDIEHFQWEFSKSLVHEFCKDQSYREDVMKNLPALESKLQEGTQQEREMMLLFLGELSKPGSPGEKRLLETLDSPSPRLQRAAVFALGSMRSTEARPRIAELLSSSDKDVAMEARKALEAIDGGQNSKQAK